MKTTKSKSIMVPLLATAVFFTLAEPRADQEKEVKVLPSDKENPLKELISGKEFMSSETQAMQKEDFRNPAMKLIKKGEKLWEKKEGETNKACSSCHNEAKNSMTSIAVRYPLYNKEEKKIINIEQRINLCRTKHMKALPLAYGSPELITMTAYVKHQARGKQVKVKVSGPAKPFFEKGRQEYERRRGQFNISCSQCHDKNYSKRFGARIVNQGHSNGYPAYILDENKTRPLHWRIETCNRMIRATPFVEGSDEYVNLELYLAWRGNGLDVETPAVRERSPVRKPE